MMRIDVPAHNKNDNYTSDEFLKRILWAFSRPLLRLIPRRLYGVRNTVYRLFGAKIGKGVRIYHTSNLFYPWNIEIGDHVLIAWDVKLYSLGKLKIGSQVIISQGAHLCAGGHDYRKENLPLIKPPIVIEDHCWICADAFVGPNVTVGKGSVIGARAVVMKDVPPGCLVAGNPAEFVKNIEGGGSHKNHKMEQP